MPNTSWNLSMSHLWTSTGSDQFILNAVGNESLSNRNLGHISKSVWIATLNLWSHARRVMLTNIHHQNQHSKLANWLHVLMSFYLKSYLLFRSTVRKFTFVTCTVGPHSHELQYQYAASPVLNRGGEATNNQLGWSMGWMNIWMFIWLED